ncbi:MAG: hypothetical protein AAFY71_09415, partial [Bacteroidota bacterium]
MSYKPEFLLSIRTLRSCSFLMLYLFCSLSIGQNKYNLSFANDTLRRDDNQFCVDALISFDQVGRLGSGKFVLTFDPTRLEDPLLKGVNISAPPIYQLPSLTQPQPGILSININLNPTAIGDQVVASPNWQVLFTLCFELEEPDSTFSLVWEKSPSIGTKVVAYGGPSAQLEWGSLEDFNFSPPPPSNLEVIWENLMLVPIANNVFVQWAVSNEKDVDHYEVERSEDKINFIKKGEAAVGPLPESTQTYQFSDVGALNNFKGKYYYRIKQVNKGGGIYYGPIDSMVSGTDPFTWNDFTLSLDRDDVWLDWDVSNEDMVRRYEVFRSGDRQNFERIGAFSLDTLGGAQGMYQWVDEGIGETALGWVYYQVKQVDGNEFFEWSPVDSLKFE